MQLLRHDELSPAPGERVFKHSLLGGFVMLLVFLAPAVAALALARTIAPTLAGLPWFVWIVGAPMLLIGFLVWLLFLQTAVHAVEASLRSTNWVLRVSSGGVGVQLRSYLNVHFRKDVPTVLWLDLREIKCARRVSESGVVVNPDGKAWVRKDWLEFELTGVDCATIEQRIAAERAEPGPQMRVLGIKTPSRYNDIPACIVRPRVLRVEWLGEGMLEALREVVAVAPELEQAA